MDGEMAGREVVGRLIEPEPKEGLVLRIGWLGRLKDGLRLMDEPPEDGRAPP